MEIKKSNLEILFNLTKGTEGVLTLTESRVRDSFIKSVQEVTKTFFEQREVIYKHFCIKNGDGEPDLIEGTKYQFSPQVQEKLTEETNTLGEEVVTIEAPENIKEILKKSEYKPKLLESEIIDELLESI